MSNGWTQERRQRQSELIHKWKPWALAGVKTEEGKNISKMNAYKHGARCAEIRNMAREFTEWKKELNQVNRFIYE